MSTLYPFEPKGEVMVQYPELTIRLTGKNIRPGAIRSREIAELITSYEDAIAAVVLADNPELNKESVVVGLSDLKEGSLALAFRPNLASLTIPAANKINTAISTRSFDTLPNLATEALRTIQRFTARHDAQAEFWTHIGRAILQATILPSLEIPTKQQIIGETIVYGEILRLGGKEPRIMLASLQGPTLYCDATRELVLSLGGKIYQTVGLRGVAKWNPDTLVIEHFEALELTDYEPKPLAQALAAIAADIGDEFPDIDISELRGEKWP